MNPSAEIPLICFDAVSKSYGANVVLNNLSLAVKDGEKVAVIGPSGSGKTTILRLLMTLETPDSGLISIGGQPYGLRKVGDHYVRDSEANTRKLRSQVGMVFQHFNLFPHMTVLQNIIEAPVHVSGIPHRDAVELARSLLGMVGMSNKIDAYPRQLSGGQQQRVAIARALAMRPRILLLDEVTSALDPELVGEVLQVVRRIARESGMTMLIVTHEMNFAREVSDRVLFMEAGRLIEDLTPERIFSAPREERTRAFLRAVVDR